MKPTIAERFWSHVQKTESCWLWDRPNQHGYGYFFPQHHAPVIAHRWAYEALRGPIPDGFHLDHLCRVRNCVNPDHLEPVTPRVNSLRGISVFAINARKTHCKRGHEFDEANTSTRANGDRNCRKCHAASERQRRNRKKETQ